MTFSKYILFSILFLVAIKAQAQTSPTELLNKAVVQLYGTISSEHNVPLSQASIFVLGTRRGTLSNEKGIYSIAVDKGSKIKISFIGFKDVEFTVPEHIQGNSYNVNVQLKEDTVTLPTTIVHALPSRAKVEREILNTAFDMTEQYAAQRSVSAEVISKAIKNLPIDGSEMASKNARNMIQTIAQRNEVPGLTFNLNRASNFLKEWKEKGW